jgi:hypothetical protein
LIHERVKDGGPDMSMIRLLAQRWPEIGISERWIIVPPISTSVGFPRQTEPENVPGQENRWRPKLAQNSEISDGSGVKSAIKITN